MSNSTENPTRSRSTRAALSSETVAPLPSSEDEHWVYSNHPDPPAYDDRGDTSYSNPPHYCGHTADSVVHTRPTSAAERVLPLRGLAKRLDRSTDALIRGAKGLLQHWPARQFSLWLGIGVVKPRHAIDGSYTSTESLRHTHDAAIGVRSPLPPGA